MIKAIRAITGLGLKVAKAVVEGVPATAKEAVSKEEVKALSLNLLKLVLKQS